MTKPKLAVVAADDDARPVIEILPGSLHDLASEGEQALIDAGVDFYTRGGQIVRPIIDEVDASKGRKTTSARLLPVGADMMLDYLSRHANWIRCDRRTGRYFSADPPTAVAKIILGRDGEWNLRPIAGVITAPTMRRDGSIVSTPGYDPITRLVLIEPPKMPPLLPKPTRDDALVALALLEDLIVEFPFVDDPSKSVALSGLITAVVRGVPCHRRRTHRGRNREASRRCHAPGLPSHLYRQLER